MGGALRRGEMQSTRERCCGVVGYEVGGVLGGVRWEMRGRCVRNEGCAWDV